MSVQLKWNRPIKQIVKDIVGNERVLKFAAAAWHKLYNPYVPMDTGTLANDAVQYGVENEAGVIRHTAPYANKHYNGIGLRHSKEKHPLATAKWDEAAKKAGKAKDLARDIQALIKRGG